ncbi:hypothetical protein PF002_g19512 [Phytophthora fragariae]|uniref:No apical meristem-associated C-terminal domain-containing protein n=1 Tax=Phytophthora fragariae TaxID=53985 RepID=A0A6A3SHN8_9STRA|nr:hypothetical protein PF003_g12177 [Phytophthora fragariae]KAE8961485.1 hypothetical protein PF011_g29732 [Phytophthora fragariae]KAE9068240.1 hypothetical protein PF006_g29836 [Phytophthora fragariae]KAE9117141.1 hypothetical protein PF007_g9409 [Phytophthora fragariae]KAE9208093.1 hypothetical protein PF002_g19512 [Phytophthora fragariae]
MGKGPEWSDTETIQLCRSWLETSEDPVVGTGQKKKSFAARLYEHWLDNKSEESGEARSVKSRERSGWSEEMYLDAALQVYADRHKQSFEFLAAWKELKDKPKWTTKLTSDGAARAKRKAGGEGDVARPIGRKAAKAERNKPSNDQASGGAAHLRFVMAAEKKAEVMEQQLHLTIFMQDPQSDESKEFFSIKRKDILAQLKKKVASTASQELDPDHSSQRQSTEAECTEVSAADKENDAPYSNNINTNNAGTTALV